MADPKSPLSVYITSPPLPAWSKEVTTQRNKYQPEAQTGPLAEIRNQQMGATTNMAEVLRAAREAIANRKRSNAEGAFRVAAAFGRPTQTGAFGESLGFGAEALADEAAARREFERQQQADLANVDTQMYNLEMSDASNRLKLLQEQMDKEQVTEKRSTTTEAGIPKGETGTGGKETTLDKEAAKAYMEYQKQAPDTVAQMTRLYDVLAKAKDDEWISGTTAGMINKYLGEDARTWLLPNSRNFQQAVENSAQRSLKAVLGAQFARVEGEMLLARAFDISLEPATNRKRATYLLKQIEAAHKNNERMFKYYNENNHSLKGFKGKTEYSMTDFLPDDEVLTIEMPDGNKFKIATWETKAQIKRRYDMEQAWHQNPGRELTLSEKLMGAAKQGYAQGGHVKKFAEGGSVKTFEDVPEEGVNPEQGGETERPNVPGLMAVGAGVGTGAGLIYAGGEHVKDVIQANQAANAGERALADEMAAAGLDPMQVVGDIMAQPEKGGKTLLTESGPGGVGLGVEAAAEGSENVARPFIEEQTNIAARGTQPLRRTMQKALDVPRYFMHEDALLEQLRERSKPLYDQAYTEGANINIKDSPLLYDYYNDLMKTPAGKKARNNALETMSNIYKEPVERLAKLFGDDTKTGQRLTLEYLDQIKQSLDDTIIKLKDANTSKKSTGEIKVLTSLRQELMDQLSAKKFPKYAQARAQYAGDLETYNSLKFGRDEIFNMPEEMLAKELKGKTPADIQAIRTGVVQHMDETLSSASRGNRTALARNFLYDEKYAPKLKMLFDNPRDFELFRSAVDAEARIFDAAEAIADEGKIKRIEAQGSGATPLQDMQPGGLRKHHLIDMAFNLIGKNMPNDKYDQLIKLFQTRNPEELQAFANRVAKRASIKARPKRYGKRALIGAGVGAAIPATIGGLKYLQNEYGNK